MPLKSAMCKLKRCLIFIFLCIPTEVLTGPDDQDCECGEGNLSDVSFHIFQDKKAPAHAYPWVVYLLYPSSYKHCGGAILNDRYIITSARCLAGYNTSDVQIVVGAHDTELQDGTKIPARKFIIHEGFKGTKDDIALIKVDPITFNPTVQPICLPNPISNFTLHSVLIAGWGTSEGYAQYKYLLKANRRILTDETCMALEEIRGDYRPEQNLCAFGFENGACEEDLGSPIMFEVKAYVYQLIGVVSWDKGCVSNKTPGIYMKVTNYVPWIGRHTNDAHWCEVNS